MIWWIIVLILAVGVAVGVKLKSDDIWGPCLFAAIVAVLVLGCCAIASTYLVISHQTHLTRIKADIAVQQERCEYVENVVAERCRAYPLEAKIYESLDPTILLRLPEIKSDTFIMAQVECLIECHDEIYKLRLAANEYRRRLKWHSRRWFSPTLVSPLSE